MRCVVRMLYISAREWSIVLNSALLRGKVYEGPLNSEGVLSSRAGYSSICFFCHLIWLKFFMPLMFFMVPFLNCSCNFAIEYMYEQTESVSVSGIFLYFFIFWHKIQLVLKSWNSTFSCRKTSWTEKVCRGSHTPGAVHSGNVITLLPVSQ